jgi:TolA-binding protein
MSFRSFHLPLSPRLLAFAALSLFSTSPSSAQQAPRAVAVEEEELPVPKAVPVEQTRPAAPASTRPKGPDEDLFDYASMIYERGEYSIASQSLGQYLQNYPSGRHVPLALFRIGECYMNQKQLKVAETYYEEVVNRYPASEGAPSAAYRLGAMAFNDRDFDRSARFFTFCETKSTLPQVKLSATFNKSRAYQMLGDTKRQIAALNTVVAVTTENPYREPALLSLGTLLLAADKKAEALPLFLELLQSSRDNAIIAEASVKAAVLQAEMGKPEESVALFQRALKLPETTGANRGIALVGVVQSLFAKGDYDGVINNYNQNATVLPEGDTRPKMLLMVGNAYRMKKSYARAVEVYLMVEQATSTDAAFEAGYWKLYCFYLLDDKDLADFATAFIQRSAQKYADHEFLNLARLIRADFHFNKQHYAEATTSFTDVKLEKLPLKLQPGTLFNKGWSQAESQRPQDAVATFTQFLTSYPAHELTSKALARRGLAYRETKDLPKAVEDFQSVIKNHPNSEAVELAYLQLGLIAAEQRDPKATIAAFELLVKKFPSSPAAGQAWFGIGRACYSLQQWDKAIQALEKAISTDRKSYLDQASLMIIQAQYVQQNTESLQKAIDDYRKSNANAAIPPMVLSWLGIKLFDQKLYSRCTQYLSLASTPDAPENTDPRVWNYLGRAFLETKDYESSIKATDHYLKTVPESAARAHGLRTKGLALLGLNQFEAADAVVQEGLGFAKDGKPQAMLLILQGDILSAQGDKLAAEGQAAPAQAKQAEAAAKFLIPSQFFDDDEVTPEALDKAAKALIKAGQPEKAAEFEKALKQKYPSYQPK